MLLPFRAVLATLAVSLPVQAVPYVQTVLTVRLRENILQLMAQPFSPLEYTTESHALDLLDLTSTQELREWAYLETLATGTGASSKISMLYVGMEDGRFLGYFSSQHYTFKGRAGGAADDPELSWEVGGATMALDTLNEQCALPANERDPTIGCVEGKTVSADCIDQDYVGKCHDVETGITTDHADQTACELAGSMWHAPCTTSGCCDSGIRNYYNTSTEARGAPVDFTRWRVYDHKFRPWYRQAIASWRDGRESSWSSVYVFSTSGQLGVTAMQTLGQLDGPREPLAVFAVDFELGDISRLLDASLAGAGEAFAYIVETGEGYSGLLIGISTGESLGSADTRASALDSASSYVAESAAVLAGRGWPGDTHIRQGNGSAGWEIHTTNVTSLMRDAGGDEGRGLPWLVVAGQVISCDASEVWLPLDGRCVTCPLGKHPEPVADRWSRWAMSNANHSWEEWLQNEDRPHECVQCPAGKATLPGQGGACVQCEDGKQPTPEVSVSCEACDMKSAGVGGHCHVCDTEGRGEVPSDDSTECVCPEGTYDSWRPPLGTQSVGANITDPYHIFCWDDDKTFARRGDAGFSRVSRGYPDTNEMEYLPDPGVGSSSPNFNQLEDFMMKGARRCVKCPKCVQCPAKNGRNMSIQEGWGLVSDSYRQAATMYGDNDLDVFKCATGACMPFRLSDDMSAVCTDELRSGPLCTRCKDMYTKTEDGLCKQCHSFEDGTTIWSAVGVGLCLILLPLVWKLALQETTKQRVALFFSTAERSWPRIRQSFNILIANWQISRSIAGNSGIEWGPWIQGVFESFGAIAQVDFLHLPGISCISGNNFYTQWLVKMCTLPFCAVVIYGIYRYQVSKVSTSMVNPRKVREVQGKLNHTHGALKEIEDNLDSMSLKFKSTVEIGLLRSRYAGLMFMLVYLLYPGVAAASFQMFHCRSLEGATDASQLRLLKADMRYECWTLDGTRSETYQIFWVLGVLAMCIYPIGVPLLLGIVLFRSRKMIQKNPDYIALGGLHPMFIFYKQGCYLWEVYFMVQKVILVGFIGLLPRGGLTNVANVSVSIFMVTVLTKVRPSKTEEYNNANILSQTVILVTYMLAQYTKNIEADLDETSRSRLQSRQAVILGSIQGLMAMYLIYISTVKLRGFWVQNREEIIQERAVAAQSHANASADQAQKDKKQSKDVVRQLELAREKLEKEENKLKLHCIKQTEAVVNLQLPSETLQRAVQRINIPSGKLVYQPKDSAHRRSLDPGIFWVLSGSIHVFDQPPHHAPEEKETIPVGSVLTEFTAAVEQNKPVVWLKAASRVDAFVLWREDLLNIIQDHGGLAARHTKISGDLLANSVVHRKWTPEANLKELRQPVIDARREVHHCEQELIKLENKVKHASSQSNAAVKKAFSIFDLDLDESLAMEEIEKVMKQMGTTLDVEEKKLLMMIAQPQADGSRTIDFEQFKLLWGSGELNVKAGEAWVGGIPWGAMEGLTQEQQNQKVVGAFMNRSATFGLHDTEGTAKLQKDDWVFIKTTGQVARISEDPTEDQLEKGLVCVDMLESSEEQGIQRQISDIERCMEPIGVVESAFVWEKWRRACWARVKFKGIHALALAMALSERPESKGSHHSGDAIVIRDPTAAGAPVRLRIDTWSLKKESALASRLAEDLDDWDQAACTFVVSGVNFEELEKQYQEKVGNEADTPITSRKYFRALHPNESSAGDFGAVQGYEYKKDGGEGPGYYKLKGIEKNLKWAPSVATKTASSIQNAGSMAISAGANMATMVQNTRERLLSRASSGDEDTHEQERSGLLQSSSNAMQEHIYSESLRRIFSPYGTYIAGTAGPRSGGKGYALVSVGKAAAIRLLAQPQPARLNELGVQTVDPRILKETTGSMPQTYKAHMETVHGALGLLRKGQDMWTQATEERIDDEAAAAAAEEGREEGVPPNKVCLAL